MLEETLHGLLAWLEKAGLWLSVLALLVVAAKLRGLEGTVLSRSPVLITTVYEKPWSR